MSRNAKVAGVTKLCSKFQFLGKFLARAIMDFRILDIPFCQILYKWLLIQEGTLDLGDLAAVDSVLAQSLTQLQQVVQKKRQLEQDSSHTPDSRQLAVESLTLDGTPIEDLGLSFALPGHPDIELKVQTLITKLVNSVCSYFLCIVAFVIYFILYLEAVSWLSGVLSQDSFNTAPSADRVLSSNINVIF